MTSETLEKIRKRIEGHRECLAKNAPYIAADQKHLDANTPERAYWHYGCMMTLIDVLALLEQDQTDGE